MSHDRVVFVLLSFVALLMVGCGNDTSTANADDEDEHRLEHHIPEHKPGSYEEGVEQLQVRFEKLQQSDNAGETALSELEDIIEWIPELAADSELRRKQWEAIQGHTQELTRLFDTMTTDGGKAIDTKDGGDAFLEQVKELRQFVEPSRWKKTSAPKPIIPDEPQADEADPETKPKDH